MGNCCGSSMPPACRIPRTEQQAIFQIAQEQFNRHPTLPIASMHIAKSQLQSGASTMRNVHSSVCSSSTKISEIQLLDPTQQQLGDENGAPPVVLPISSSIQPLVDEVHNATYDAASRVLLTSMINTVQNAPDPKIKKETAERALNNEARNAVLKAIGAHIIEHKGELAFYARGGDDGSEQGGSPAVPSVPQQWPVDSYHDSYNNLHQQQQQQNENGINNLDPNQLHGGINVVPDSPTRGPGDHDHDGVADWHRYPVPEDQGPWVQVNEAFYWSESAGLYYMPACGHFYHVDSDHWFDPESNTWMDEEQHEDLLEQMAAANLY